ETYEGTKTAGGTAIKVSSEYDASAAVDKIKGFVEQYNKLIDTIHKKLSEEHFRDFAPLTEMQKEEMTEKEIELWEEKAKSGLLKGDRILEGITGQMRRALIDAVEGAGLTLSDIGIKTGNYMEKGKLLLDEAKLTDALQNRGDEGEKLFAAQSEISYSSNLTSAQRAQRYKQSGLMHRISDILNDYIRTTRDENGNKGILLERAGIVGDVSEFKNTLSEKIKRIDSRISDAVRLLQSKEESYWRKFTAMEKAIQQMNSQSAWLSQQLGGNNL
ncbi:MAG: flagellar filament capping protein FliD, partial [Dethiobacteria bacterium]